MDTYSFVLLLIGSLLTAMLSYYFIRIRGKNAILVKETVQKAREEAQQLAEAVKHDTFAKLEPVVSRAMGAVAQIGVIKRRLAVLEGEQLPDEDVQDDGGLPSQIQALMRGAGLDPDNPADVQKGIQMVLGKVGGQGDQAGEPFNL